MKIKIKIDLHKVEWVVHHRISRFFRYWRQNMNKYKHVQVEIYCITTNFFIQFQGVATTR